MEFCAKLVMFGVSLKSYAPINIMPHYPPYGRGRGLWGDLTRKFFPSIGAFDMAPDRNYEAHYDSYLCSIASTSLKL